jgi:hypothetical protein
MTDRPATAPLCGSTMRKFRISGDGLRTTRLAIPVTLINSGHPGSSGDISNMCSL